jgi:hypothetical protein
VIERGDFGVKCGLLAIGDDVSPVISVTAENAR